MTITGTIIDAATRRPVPYASVSLRDQLGADTNIGTSANAVGVFSIAGEPVRYPNELLFTSVGFHAMGLELGNDGQAGVIIPMSKDIVELEPVVVSSSKKTSDAAGIGIAALLLLVATQKKQAAVGKVKVEHVVIGFTLIAGLMGIDAISKFFKTLGMGGEGNDQATGEATNPASPWKPAFLTNIPAGTDYLLLKNDAAEYFSYLIASSFTVMQDNYNEIMGVFSQLKTKSQVASLAKKFFEKYGQDLLTFLRDGGGVLPWDGLSDSHLKEITDLVNNMPQYKPR